MPPPDSLPPDSPPPARDSPPSTPTWCYTQAGIIRAAKSTMERLRAELRARYES